MKKVSIQKELPGNVEESPESYEEEKIQGGGDSLFQEDVTFKDLGVCDEICESCVRLNYKHPTKIQKETIPYTLKGKDIIGLAETGSGKTLAFAIPIIQSLLENPQPYYACVLAPTRELSVQISEQFEALGASIALRCCVIVGGLDPMSQAIALSKKPHIIIGTPGRLLYHLENTKGFSFKNLKYLVKKLRENSKNSKVFDEADKLLNMDFEKEINKILEVIPKKRNTYLFSATMTNKVGKLQKASLNDPVKVEVSQKYICFLKKQYKIGFPAVAIHGKLTQVKRLGALNKFKSKEKSILIATDVAARGLDIPSVDLVLNYDIPQSSKSYVHRVGRTARAGRSGRSISFVTQYDIENYQKIEFLIGKKLDVYPTEEEEVLIFNERVEDAMRIANQELKEMIENKLKKNADSDDEGKNNKNRKNKPHKNENINEKRKSDFQLKDKFRKKKMKFDV